MKNKEKLPIAFKKKWLKALRSGEYQQGIGELKSIDGKYCCLGVAAEVCGATRIKKLEFIKKGNKIRGITKIPNLLIGDRASNSIVYKLSTMNDEGESFKKIANYIEKHL